jgi:hypothetical protein
LSSNNSPFHSQKSPIFETEISKPKQFVRDVMSCGGRYSKPLPAARKHSLQTFLTALSDAISRRKNYAEKPQSLWKKRARGSLEASVQSVRPATEETLT